MSAARRGGWWAVWMALGLSASAQANKPRIVESIENGLQLIVDGQFDAFLARYVDPVRTDGPHAVDNWEHSLERAKRNGGACLHDGKVKVASWRGDPATDDLVTVYIDCGDGMPRPSSHRRVGDTWKITTISW